MIRINLLPYRAARKKENVRFQVNIFLGSLIVLSLAIVWANIYLSGRINRLNGEIGATQSQLVKYQQINNEIADIKKKLELLNRKIEVIESLERDRKAPVRNLDSLYQLIVEKRMWYTQLDEKGGTIKVSGIAVDNQTVADYMTRVEKAEQFENVRLLTIKQQKFQGTDVNLKQFDVDFQKKKSPEELAKEAAQASANKDAAKVMAKGKKR
jgi:type IV pilus assembly protein PilN